MGIEMAVAILAIVFLGGGCLACDIGWISSDKKLKEAYRENANLKADLVKRDQQIAELKKKVMFYKNTNQQ